MRRSRSCHACPGERLQAPLGPANSLHCPVDSHDRLRSPTLARIGMYDPSYTACVSSTLWRVHGLSSPPMCVTMCAPPPLMLCVFLPELFSDCRSESVLVLQAASLVLACKCRSLQLPAEAIQPAVMPECTSPRYTRTSPSRGSVLHAHAHAHYMHTEGPGATTD